VVTLRERRGSQTARIRIIPDGVDHPRWAEIEDFVRRLGVELDPWQWEIFRVALMRHRDLDLWAAFTVAAVISRQNGKNVILEVRELVGACLLGESLIVHSAHLADTSKEGFRRLDSLIDANEWLSKDVRHIWRTNGHEAIEFRNGNRIRFRTRTRGGGRGFSGSPVIFDEAMIFPDVSMGSIMPVVSAQPDPQAWYMGSAVDQQIHDDGVVFARVRDRALKGNHSRLAYWEWSLEYDSPNEVPREDELDLHVAAAATNPAYGQRISPDYIEAEARELTWGRSLFVERFGVGDWPPVDGSSSAVFSLEKWDALTDDPRADGARMQDPICLAFDCTPERSAGSIAAVGRRDDGFAQLEIPDHRNGVAWIPERLAALDERHMPLAILCDAAGPAGSLLPACYELGLNVETVTAPDLGKACGLIFDKVETSELRHLGGTDLRNAVRGATKRSLGEAWAWSRRNSTVDISPLVAGTLALWGFESLGASDEIRIY
jgi:hypothetical protein